MKLDVYNLANEKVDEIEVSDTIFGVEVKPYLFHEVVKMQLAARRRGTHKTKSRAAVSGGGRKPWRQKGTGRARQGTTRAPHWVGGGHAFAKTNRDYSFKMNKKKRRAALRSALSMLVAEGRFKVVNSFGLEAVKTKEAKKALEGLSVERAIVIDGQDCTGEGSKQVSFENNDKLRLSVRNLKSYKYLRPDGVNVYDILKFGAVVVTLPALRGIEARLS